jgi:hypothetical protein
MVSAANAPITLKLGREVLLPVEQLQLSRLLLKPEMKKIEAS